MEIFWDKGFEGTSMVDLTAGMGIGAPSLYAAFGSKEELFRAAVALYISTDGADIWAAITKADTAYGAIEGFLMETARLFSRPGKPSGCLVVLSALHSTDGNEALRAELIAKRLKNTADLAGRLAKGIDAGELSPETDVDKLARFYVTVQQGMSIQARDGADRSMLEEIARSALAAWGPLTSKQDR
jgi:AcrR family transcriptional regulator